MSFLIKILILWILLSIILNLLAKGLEKFYSYLVFKQIREMNPKEKHEWEKQILQECRHKAYREKNFDLVDKISRLLEEKYND